MAGPDVREAASVAEVVAAVREYAGQSPDQEWIQGGPYDATLAPGGLFDAVWLDEAVADRPVVLQSMDHHCAWVKTEALRRADIGSGRSDPPSGIVARRADGTPLGTLVEWSAMDLVLRHAPATTRDEKETGVETATALLASAGVTWRRRPRCTLTTWTSTSPSQRPDGCQSG